MLITAIQIRKTDNSGSKLIGVATITLGNMIAIHDIKILKSNTGLFLAMPSRKKNTGDFADIVHPINSEVRTALENLIFYGVELANASNLYSLELKANNFDASSLLEQNISDFSEGIKIQSQFVGKSNAKDSITQRQTKINPQKNVPSNKENSEDVFQKWLES